MSFLTRKPRSYVRILIWDRTWPICAHHFFCSQVFKTSDVLNSDENIVNIALITFCSLMVTKLANWPMSSSRALVWCGSLADSLLQLSFVLAFFRSDSV